MIALAAHITKRIRALDFPVPIAVQKTIPGDEYAVISGPYLETENWMLRNCVEQLRGCSDALLAPSRDGDRLSVYRLRRNLKGEAE